MVFDGLVEEEGAWVDDGDDWHWEKTPKRGLPTPLPVAGAWRPGEEAGLLEKIYLSRAAEHGHFETLKCVLSRDRARTKRFSPTPRFQHLIASPFS